MYSIATKLPPPARSRMTDVVVERVGVAKNRNLGFPVMFQRVRVKLSTKFRAWPFPGDPEYIELDPSEWRRKYTVIEEHKTDAPARPS